MAIQPGGKGIVLPAPLGGFRYGSGWSPVVRFT
jgi:hypothetical protein